MMHYFFIELVKRYRTACENMKFRKQMIVYFAHT